MKLLLTSNGLSTDAIARALFELVGKPAGNISVAFIPTAMNVSASDKSWFIADLQNLKKNGIGYIDIVDISALPKDVWYPRLKSVDVFLFGGGNSFHLMHWIVASGLQMELPKLLKTRVWVGISAGSMVTNPTLVLSSKDKKIYYEKTFGKITSGENGLGLVDFYVRPHYNSPDFPNANHATLAKVTKSLSQTVYALDDQSALKVVDGRVEVISSGEYYIFNQK